MPIGPWMQQALNIGSGLLGAGVQSLFGKSAAEQQYENDLALMKYQNTYNSPVNQMKRFKEAGLNPNLIYGQGNAGNMSSAPSSPQIPSPQVQAVLSDVGTKVAQMELMKSQTSLTNQKVMESGVKQDVMKAQKSLIQANPYLNQDYVNAMVTNLQSIAAMKDQEARFMLGNFQKGDGKSITINTDEIGMAKMEKELQLIYQRFNLNQSDQAIKAKVLESKEFQNALQEIQLKWMRDKEITPQHIYMGLMMLLQKMM